MLSAAWVGLEFAGALGEISNVPALAELARDGRGGYESTNRKRRKNETKKLSKY